MSKIKRPTDLLIKENVLRILWEEYKLTKNKKVGSSYKIARLLGIDACHALDYMRRWHEHKLLILTEVENKERTYGYFSLNPEFFTIGDDFVSFQVDKMEITIKKKNGRRE